jgi:glycine cleavage system aminomethyltransferase T
MNTKVVPILGNDVMFLRQGMAGEIGFELHGPFEQREDIYRAVFEAGQEFGIRRLGRRTIVTNHLEACYPTTGVHYWNALSDARRADFHKFMDENLPAEWAATPFAGPARHNFATSFTGSWDGDSIEDLYRSPIEMGWANTINFDHDFIGRSALEAEAARPRRKVVTLEFNSEDMVRIYASLFGDGDTYQLFEVPHPPYITAWTDWILKDGDRIGHATHPGYSFYFRKALAISFVDIEHSEPATEVDVLWGNPGNPQTSIRAVVARAPYKQDDRRRDLSRDPIPSPTAG